VNDFDHVLHMPVGDERERCAIPSLESAHHAVVVVDGIRSRLVSVAKRRLFALGRKNLNGIGTWILL
jgi:hypothetical protein